MRVKGMFFFPQILTMLRWRFCVWTCLPTRYKWPACIFSVWRIFRALNKSVSHPTLWFICKKSHNFFVVDPRSLKDIFRLSPSISMIGFRWLHGIYQPGLCIILFFYFDFLLGNLKLNKMEFMVTQYSLLFFKCKFLVCFILLWRIICSTMWYCL